MGHPALIQHQAVRDLVGDDQNLEAALSLWGVEGADAARLVEGHAEIIGDQVNIACGWIYGEGAGSLAGGQGLDDRVGIGDVLMDDGETSHGGAVGGVDEAAVGIVADGFNAVADGQGGDGWGTPGRGGRSAHGCLRIVRSGEGSSSRW